MSDVPAQNAPRGFRGPVACQLASITYRQLDYWDRTGLVSPSVRGAHGSGTQRLYSRADVIELALVKLMLDAGTSLQTVRVVLPELRRDPSAPQLVMRGHSDIVTITIDVTALAARIPDPPVAELATNPAPAPTLTLVP